jgi:hypothetical protein
MLWSKQFFFFDGDNWLSPLSLLLRQWFHMLNETSFDARQVGVSHV